jgi:hypothetical protein
MSGGAALMLPLAFVTRSVIEFARTRASEATEELTVSDTLPD